MSQPTWGPETSRSEAIVPRVLRTPLIVQHSLNRGAPLLPELEPEPLELGASGP